MVLPSEKQEVTSTSQGAKVSKRPKLKPTNPIEEAIRLWYTSLPHDLLEHISLVASELILNAPKRWVVYPPMVLLPSGSFEDKHWTEVRLGGHNLDSLWEKILEQVGKREGKGNLTRLAINNGIPLLKASEDTEANLLRNPTGLIILYGNFGPSLDPGAVPSSKDFEEAFWVSTKQNGITQIWAPRYTMFSRGNIKEKARILDFHKTEQQPRAKEKAVLVEDTAVDMYAGIGYFVFSYVKMGLGRVIGFELNPWSVEGLRRGALANGWSIKVVKAGDAWTPGDERITIFEEDNAAARSRLLGQNGPCLKSVTHINCGLLPSSEGSWGSGLDLLSTDGWLHLHENVGVNDIDSRRQEIEKALLHMCGTQTVDIKVEHVELVKTFAPGVWHCVFDVCVTRP